MKKLFYLLSLIGMVLMASCSTETEERINPLDPDNQVKFTSTIGEVTETRASGTSWDSGDAIGVYAVTAGNELSAGNLYKETDNFRYTTPGDGVFKAAAAPIIFPDEGSIDFYAYYPYRSSINDFIYRVDVTNQTKPEDIDLLYSDNAKDGSKSNNMVNLNFKHKMSLLIVDITAGEGVASLNGLEMKIEDLKVTGNMSLKDGKVTSDGDAKTIVPQLNVTETSAAVATAILVPDQDFGDAKIHFALNDRLYEWIPETQSLESGKKYSYKLQLTQTGLISVHPEANIEDWEDGYIGTEDIVLEPEDDTGTSEAKLLFPGADFEDWDLFLSSLTSKGLKAGYTEQSDNGVDGSKALYLNGTPTGNDYVFTATVPEGFSRNNLNEIVFWIKGTSAKSLSVNVYKGGTAYSVFNLGNYSESAVLEPAANNQYVGTIDTDGKWMKVTLDISSVDLASVPGESLFAIKAGKDAAYDLLIDNITLGDGDIDDTPPEPTDGDALFAGADFEDWESFVGGLNNFGLKPGYTSQSNDGRDGSKALYINGTPSGNDYVFTALAPEGISASGKNAIVFWMKGTGGKSLSLNVYESSGSFKPYNLGTYNSEQVISPAPDNQYTGTINTAGQWVKVILDISSLDLQTEVGKDIFALKVGKDVAYDLLVDDFTLEYIEGLGEEEEPEPGAENLLFPGSDFNNWSTFMNSLSSFGLTFGVESNNGKNGSKAMLLNGQHGSNAYVFTAVVPTGFSAAGKTKIEFYIKGTAVKSLSLNVYVGTGNEMGVDYKCYNMDEFDPYNSPQTLQPTNSNSYTKGGIDTGGNWMKVTLDISSIASEINTDVGQNLFALKIGSKADYDLLIDDITIQ